ncbi:hypothetical protein B0H15DRAFT_465847 [Mycena belliarum]|uniref:Uncharacterized protein n=1 Tax=Mycena belliarum TaxID=1033014 RepID=A0AAD6UF48_9AGAR|nr:hypothetical protein B0H15DRAFT_465847 [Mycena belliae]
MLPDIHASMPSPFALPEALDFGWDAVFGGDGAATGAWNEEDTASALISYQSSHQSTALQSEWRASATDNDGYALHPRDTASTDPASDFHNLNEGGATDEGCSQMEDSFVDIAIRMLQKNLAAEKQDKEAARSVHSASEDDRLTGSRPALIEGHSENHYDSSTTPTDYGDAPANATYFEVPGQSAFAFGDASSNQGYSEALYASSVSPIYKDAPLHATSPDVAQQRAIAFENASIGAFSLPQSEIHEPEEAEAEWRKFSAAAFAHPLMQAWARLRHAPLAMPTFDAMPPPMLPRYSPPSTWPTNDFNAYWPVPQAPTHYSPATWSTNAPSAYGPMPLQSSTPTTSSGSSTPYLSPRHSYYRPRAFRDATPVSTLTSPMIPQPIAGPSRPYRRVDRIPIQAHQETTKQRKSNRAQRRHDPVAIADNDDNDVVVDPCHAGHITAAEYKELSLVVKNRQAAAQPSITCRWGDCMEEVAWGDLQKHLENAHQCWSHVHQNCQWVKEGRACTTSIKGGSTMKKHILSMKHLAIFVECPRCGKHYSRMDALKRHLVGDRR